MLHIYDIHRSNKLCQTVLSNLKYVLYHQIHNPEVITAFFLQKNYVSE